MIIHPMFKEKLIKGSVIFSDKAIKNAVIVKMEEPITGVGKDIFLLFNSSGWYDVNGMQEHYPALFNQFLHRIQNVLDRCASF